MAVLPAANSGTLFSHCVKKVIIPITTSDPTKLDVLNNVYTTLFNVLFSSPYIAYFAALIYSKYDLLINL